MIHKHSIWKVLGFSVLLFGTAALVGVAVADENHPPGHGMPHHPGTMGGEYGMEGHGMKRHPMSLSPLAMKDQLGLTDDQVKAIEPLETNYRKTSIKSSADIRIAMIELGSLLDQKETDRNAVSAQVDEISSIQKQMMTYRVETLLKLKEILTPDQYSQFRAQLKAQMERGMGRRMHGMGGMMWHGKMGDYGDDDDDKGKKDDD